jgi:hypothetical protein
MKKTRKVLLVAVITITAVLWVSCASGPSSGGGGGYPKEITDWLTENPDATYGLGISTITDDISDAYRQATKQALGDLAQSIETKVAVVGGDAVKRSGKGEDQAKVSKFEDAAANTTGQVIAGAKNVGPYTDNKGNIYLIKYVANEDLAQALQPVVKEVFADTDAKLENILNSL